MSWLYGTVEQIHPADRFGFITQDDAENEKDIFFHQNDLVSSGLPEKGDRVRYRSRWSSRKGKYHAIDVQLLHEFDSGPAASDWRAVEPSICGLEWLCLSGSACCIVLQVGFALFSGGLKKSLDERCSIGVRSTLLVSKHDTQSSCLRQGEIVWSWFYEFVFTKK